MKAIVRIHETWEQAINNNRTPRVILKLDKKMTWKQFNKIHSNYENKIGKYGMNNPSLDKCWFMPDNY